jgi:SAM-dependent methyltransferase
MRALIHLLSVELFGHSLNLTQFPRLKSIRGIGMTDNPLYAKTLSEKFDYSNTFYNREPRLDFTESHPDLAGTFDFILSADVLEHIAPPLERALAEVAALLKPGGFLVATVPCPSKQDLLEHFPELHDYRIVSLGDTAVLINRRRDGIIEVREDLLFHSGDGSTLEMRQLSPMELREKLLLNGFDSVEFLSEDIREIGMVFTPELSQPLIARKGNFELTRAALREFVDLWRRTEERRDLFEKQIAMASTSRWVRLGRALGIGPRFS